MKQQIARHIAWPKNMNIQRLWVWLPPLNHKPGAVTGKNMAINLLESGENSDGSLLAGELSDGCRGGASMMQVPKGFLAVYVGPELRRFVIPMSCLSSPDFRVLMDRVEEEYGFEQEGALKIPCDEEDFEHILMRSLANYKKNDKKKKI
ncbi:auxin-responsive protein SAUR71-like [Malus sylvestris]|uniref:auxin-responsive protein SAUR71-like n=1 Tax=Malus sylvestris TaxID=3752 RepID=UPI0021ACFBD0|nr:auxin-responsive protein SAUR71-like [Malus sylvestris]